MSDAVNHPAYYNRGNIEVIDFIEDWRLDFSMGSFIKYVCRAGLKDNYVQDLNKAKWYINRFVDHPCVPVAEGWGTYDWREFAESQGLERELCTAVALAYEIYYGQDVELNLDDVVALIDTCINRYQHDLSNKTEHGVLEMGSEN